MIFLTTAMLMMPVVRPWAVNLSVGDVLLCVTVGTLLLSGRIKALNIAQEEPKWFISGWLLLAGFALSDLVQGGRGDFNSLFTLAQYLTVIVLIPLMYLGGSHPQAAYYGLLAGALINVAAAILAWKYDWMAIGTVAGRLSGLMENPNTLAKNLAIPAILFLDLGVRSHAIRGLWGYAGVLFCFIGAILAASFGGLMAMGFGLAAYLFMVGKRKLLYGIGSFFVGGYILVATGLMTSLSENIDERMARASAQFNVRELGSFERKLGLMRESIDTILSNPIIGRGLSYEGDIDSIVEWNVVHNWELLVYETGGILAFMGAVGIIIYLFGSVRSRVVEVEPEMRAAAYASLGVFILNAQTNTHMYSRYWWVGMFVVLRMLRTSIRKPPVVSSVAN